MTRQSFGEQFDFVRDLEKQGDIKTLIKISHVECEGSRVAAAAIVRLLLVREAIAYCKSLPLDSLHWRSAFMALVSHPKNDVLPYLLELVHSPDSVIRGWCYRFCHNRHWPEWMSYAIGDTANKSMFGYINQPSNISTVGDMAKVYVDDCNRR